MTDSHEIYSLYPMRRQLYAEHLAWRPYVPLLTGLRKLGARLQSCAYRARKRNRGARLIVHAKCLHDWFLKGFNFKISHTGALMTPSI